MRDQHSSTHRPIRRGDVIGYIYAENAKHLGFTVYRDGDPLIAESNPEGFSMPCGDPFHFWKMVGDLAGVKLTPCEKPHFYLPNTHKWLWVEDIEDK